jgi:hypothetical protein
MRNMRWTQRWFRRAAIPASDRFASETAPSDEPNAPSERAVPGGFRRPPVDHAGRLARSGMARSSANPVGRVVPGGFRRPPVDHAGRLSVSPSSRDDSVSTSTRMHKPLPEPTRRTGSKT